MNDIKEIMVAALIEDSKEGRDVDMSHEEACFTAQFQLDKLKEAGFVIVPKEANNDMITAGIFASQNGYKFDEVYNHMIEASRGGDV